MVNTNNKADLGKVAITVAKDPWNANTKYEKLTQVFLDGDSYVSLKDNKNVNPSTDTTGTWAKSTAHGKSLYELLKEKGLYDGTEEEFIAEWKKKAEDVDKDLKDFDDLNKEFSVIKTVVQNTVDNANTAIHEAGEATNLANSAASNATSSSATAVANAEAATARANTAAANAEGIKTSLDNFIAQGGGATDAQVIVNTENIATLGSKQSELSSKTSEISKEVIETDDENIIIEDKNGNIVAEITPDSSTFKNLKSNGKDVLTEHQDISGLATKEEVNKFEKNIEPISNAVSQETKEETAWSNDTETEEYVKIGDYGIKAKEFLYLNNKKLKPFPCVIVAKDNKGDYSSIQSAIDNTADGAVILVMPGIYKEHVVMYNKNRHLIGINKESVIVETHSGLRSDNPCNANVGSIENITFIAYIDEAPDDYWERPVIDRATYPIHIDARYVSNERHSITIKNCRCLSYANAAIGIGVRFNQTINLIDCEFITNHPTTGGFYMHNDDFNPNSSGSEININNCYMQGVSKAAVMESLQNNALCELTFINNTCVCVDNGVKSIEGIATSQINHKWGSDISNSILSHNNNINELNY